MLKEYLEINVKNDEQLVKLKNNRSKNYRQKEEYQIVEMSLVYQKEKKQLMDFIESDVQELQIKKDEIDSSISKEN